MQRLQKIVKKLRSKSGCPWDREQTLNSLKQYLVEECYEVVDSIESDNIAMHKEELGDLLLQVVLQAQIRKEQGRFGLKDVVDHLCKKLVRRHPHVFGKIKVSNAEEVLRNWEIIKAREKTRRSTGSRSMVSGISRHLPALHKAHEIQKRVARLGFDWSQAHEIFDKIEEELAEVKKALAQNDTTRIKEELGDLLFTVVNLSRFHGIHPEEALNNTISRFVRRFERMEKRMRADGLELSKCTLAEMDAYWNKIKKPTRKKR